MLVWRIIAGIIGIPNLTMANIVGLLQVSLDSCCPDKQAGARKAEKDIAARKHTQKKCPENVN